ncbi:MAG: hypothetical protein ACHQEB_00180 [Chitinophagales bacterium]
MKKIIVFSLLIILLADCNNKKDIPDVSGIKVNMTIERFDRDFFAIDSNNVLPGLNHVNEKYPLLTNLFLQNILGLDSASTLPGVKRFLHLVRPLHDAADDIFKTTDWLEKDLKKAFQFVKYYFPAYKLPEKVVAVVGPIDALAKNGNDYTPDFIGPDFLGISLQFYLGKDFPLYKEQFFMDNVAPEYRSRRFSKEFIVSDAMKLIVDDLFPDKSNGKPLVDQMIERGKQWYLLDKFLPEIPDSLKTGYTQQQLNWCKENEGLIWSNIIRNEDLNSIDPVTIQNYIGESPFTQGFSQELSPGNIGQWIGWQVVKKFADKNSEMKPQDIMQADPKKILEEAKYKPK